MNGTLIDLQGPRSSSASSSSASSSEAPSSSYLMRGGGPSRRNQDAIKTQSRRNQELVVPFPSLHVRKQPIRTTDLLAREVAKSVLRGHQRSSEVIRGHHRSSEAVRATYALELLLIAAHHVRM